jgi:TP901 family phage tail tape measure protein
MGNVFSLYGELKADTKAFEASLLRADALLEDTAHAISITESQARKAGLTSATSARQFEKLNDAVLQQQKRVLDAAEAFKKGDISVRQFASVINQTDSKVSSLNSRISDASARITDFGNRSKNVGSMFKSVFQASLAAAGITNLGLAMKDFVQDGLQMFATLDKLTRYTATLDKSFQGTQALEKFQSDIKQLSTEIPHSAESIAKASFSIKSAFQDMKEPELINFLHLMGDAATASNVDIAEHADRVVALAKAYKVPVEGLREFSAILTTTFGNALARDEEVGKGFQSLISPALRAGQSMSQLAAAMGAMQSMSTDAALNSTYLRQVLVKLVDPKFAEGMHEIGVEVYNQAGGMRDLSDIVTDLTNRLKGLSMEQKNALLAPIMKDQRKAGGWEILMQSLDKYKDGLSETAKSTEVLDAKTSVMADSASAKYQKLTNSINNFKMSIGAGVLDAVSDIQKMPPPKAWSGEEWRGVIIKGLRMGLTGAQNDVMPVANESGAVIGRAIDAGLIMGIDGGQSGVIAAAIRIAQAAWYAAKDVLGIQSPSKVFVGIGKDVVQGFIDGIESLKASAQQTMASLVDVRNIKGAKFGKADAPGLELIGSLSNELARLNADTKVQQTLLDLSAGKYGKVSAQIKDLALSLAGEIDRQNSAKEGLSQLNSAWDEFITKALPALTATEQLNATLADPKVIEAMKTFNAEMRTRIEGMLRLGALMKDTQDLTPGSGRTGDEGQGPGLVLTPGDQGTLDSGANIPPPPTGPVGYVLWPHP